MLKKTSAKKMLKSLALPGAPAHENKRSTGLPACALENKQAGRPAPHYTSDDGEIPLDAEPFGSRPLPPPFAQVLEGVLQKLKVRVSPMAEMLRAEWSVLLPPDLASRCRPGKMAGQALYVYVSDSTTLF
ncbi:MAG: DUF721 domain-containing protein, partial [Kiritimatiellaeota bacterium]|nr:DUF721 domain-containing protein [Kiritimatiellota bacterium]